jgi:hypothetical protein
VNSYRFASIVVAVALGASAASAQPLGTYSWQFAPLCNVVTLKVVQVDAIYTLQGTDDQCGAPTAAAATGLAFVNPNGTLGFGISILTTPGGVPVTVDASITLPGLSGSWRDSGGRSGTFAFAPSAGSQGPARPMPALNLEAAVGLLQEQVDVLKSNTTRLAAGTAVIPPGLTATGVVSFRRAAATGPSSGTETIMFPATAPVALTDTMVNFQFIWYGMDNDYTCTGSVAAPTAPPGKVCIYVDRWTDSMRLIEGQALPLSNKGFKIVWTANGTDATEEMSGSWAYTSPPQ